MNSFNPIASSSAANSDAANIARPKNLENFIGQANLRSNLRVFIEAAKKRNEALDHILFYGPPGLGKTTLAFIVASEMGVNIKISSGPTISKIADLNSILTNLKHGDILFIDEIHRLNIAVEENLYTAMEDFALDLIIGESSKAKSVRLKLARFTLIGATTRLGLISQPLRDRFSIPMRLDLYEIHDICTILKNLAIKLELNLSDDAINAIAIRSRRTPRIAIQILRRIRDFVHALDNDLQSHNTKLIECDFVLNALERLKIDKHGFNDNDHRYLKFIASNYMDRPVGIETIASGILEKKDTIEDTIEPYLIQKGFLSKTTRGRVLTKKAIAYVMDIT